VEEGNASCPAIPQAVGIITGSVTVPTPVDQDTPTLLDTSPTSITLYMAEIDKSLSRANRIDELTWRSRDLVNCTELDEQRILSATFGNTPEGKYTIVQIPKGESTKTMVCGVVAENMLTSFLWLLDLDFNHSPPSRLLDYNLFFLQATSPSPQNTEWAKERFETITFVLNPPGEEEVKEASVFYSLFLHP